MQKLECPPRALKLSLGGEGHEATPKITVAFGWKDHHTPDPHHAWTVIHNFERRRPAAISQGRNSRIS